MAIESLVAPLEHVSENDDVDRGEGEAILKEPEKHVAAVKSNVSEHPKGIGLGVADDEQVADDKVDALGVAHGGEVVGDTAQNEGERLLLVAGH